MSDEFTYGVTDQTVGASNTFTSIQKFMDTAFVIAVGGTFVGTVTLQVRPDIRDVSQDWTDEQTYTKVDTQQSRTLRGSWEVRAGFKSGDYVSGSAHITLAA